MYIFTLHFIQIHFGITLLFYFKAFDGHIPSHIPNSIHCCLVIRLVLMCIDQFQCLQTVMKFFCGRSHIWGQKMTVLVAVYGSHGIKE